MISSYYLATRYLQYGLGASTTLPGGIILIEYTFQLQGQPDALPAGASDVPRGSVGGAHAQLRPLRLLRAPAHHQVCRKGLLRISRNLVVKFLVEIVCHTLHTVGLQIPKDGTHQK